MPQAAQLIICHSKLKIQENFQTGIPRNKWNILIAILLSFFIKYFANFIQELPNSMQTLWSPFQRFKMQFFGKKFPEEFQRNNHNVITVPKVYSEWSRTSKMKLFEKNISSHLLFQLFTINTKSSILDVWPCFILAKGCILMFDWVLGMPLTCLKKDENCKKPVKELFLETLH